MAETTPLDLAQMAAEESPEDSAARLRFYDRLVASELFLLIETDEGAEARPVVFALSDGPFVMAFDREDRLAAFCDAPAPYAAISGRALVARLAGSGTGLGLNLGVAPSSFLMGSEAVDWLAAALPGAPLVEMTVPRRFAPPSGLPSGLVEALDARFAAAAGLARSAGLAAVVFEDGRRGHMVAFIDALPAAETGLAQSVAEALAFSGVEAGEIAVAFFGATDVAAEAFARAALMFDIPAAEDTVRTMTAPGTDPARPPRLR